MKRLFILIAFGLLIISGCSDQLKNERVFSGSILTSGTGSLLDGVYITAFQSNGKNIDNLKVVTDDGVFEGGSYRLSLLPFQNDEATDVTLSAKALYIVSVNGGISRLVYNLSDVVIPKAEVLEQPADEDIVKEIVTSSFGSVKVTFVTTGQNTSSWNAVISVTGEDVAHELEIEGSDFGRGNLQFPVQANGEVTVKVVGQKGGEAFTLEKRVSLPGFGQNNANVVFEP
jgi:hypothetical protein